MATIYVRSTDGSNTDNGSTWALAKLDLAGAAAIDAAGDTIYVSDAHNESTAADTTIAFAGTPASPVRIICGDDVAEPPTAVATSGVMSTTGASDIVITGSLYVYGMTFNCGSSTSAAILYVNNSAGHVQAYKNCTFNLVSTGASVVIQVGIGGVATTPSNETLWESCNAQFSGTGQRIEVAHGNLTWRGGQINSDVAVTQPFRINAGSGRGGNLVVEGVDLSNIASTADLVIMGSAGASAVFKNCKLPASWSGTLVSGAVTTGGRAEMYNCDSGDTNYNLLVADYYGTIVDETTIVRTGGANDGTTGLSWKMVANASAGTFAVGRLETSEIVIWNETTGSKTVTAEFVHDSATNMTDAEIWIEVMYLGTSGFPLGSWITDAKADVLASAADQTDSTETWTTTGLTNPNTQKLSVTFTANEKGYVHARVVLCKASKTVYVCPKLTLA